MFSREVQVEVRLTPVLEDKRQDQQDWDREQVVVVHRIEVLEVRELDPFAHAQEVSGRAKAVQQHPDVAGVERGDLRGSLSVDCAAFSADGVQSGLDVGPCGDDAGENHEAE